MKKFTLFCSLSMVFACGGDDDSGATSAPTTMGMDTDASTGSTSDAPTTNNPTTNDSDPTTTGPTTNDPDTGETEEESDDQGVDTTDTDEDTDEPGEAISFAEEVWPIISACSCHVNNAAGGLSLSQANAYANIVGEPAAQHATMNLVEPGSAADSYLWHKVNHSHIDVGGSGDPMPRMQMKLSDAQIALIAEWIDDGAEP